MIVKDSQIEIENEIKSLGGRIRSARLAKNITMKSIADSAGISRQTLASIERGSGKQKLVDYISVIKSLGFLNDIQSVVSLAEVAKIIQVESVQRERARNKHPKESSYG